MNKKLFFFFVAVIFFLSAAGQKKVDDYESAQYGPGAKKVTTVSTDEKLNKIVTIEILDKDSIVRVRSTWINDVEGKWSEEIITYSPGGKIECKVYSVLDKDKKLVRYEVYTAGYNKTVYLRAANGDMLATDDGSIFPEAETHEKRMQDAIKEIEEKTIPSLEPGTTPCSQAAGGNCWPKARLFAAYSYLSAFGDNGESFPMGAHASFIFNLSPHIGAGVDASMNTKKINDVSVNRVFILAIGKYSFGNVNNCNRTFIPDLHVLAGLVSEKYGTSKGSGFAFGGGGGLDIKLTKNMALGAQVDILGSKFKNTDQLITYLRASAGVVFNLMNKGY